MIVSLCLVVYVIMVYCLCSCLFVFDCIWDVCVSGGMCLCVCVDIRMCLYVCVYACMYLCSMVYVYVCVKLDVCVCVCTRA